MVGGEHPYDMFLDSRMYPADSLDEVVYRVNYSYSFVTDTSGNITDRGIGTLEIGRNVTKYYNYYYFLTDSLVRSGRIRHYMDNSNNITPNVSDPVTYYESFIHRRSRDVWTCTGRIVTQDFLYEDKIPPIEWRISDSISVILGYSAVMAECTFRGRDYVAWFTTEIPVSAGPWKFSGLPGLILCVSDSEGYYRFEATEAYATSCPLLLPDYLYLKAKRKKYIQAMALYYTNRKQAQVLYLVNTEWYVEYEAGELMDTKTLGNDFIERE